MERLAAGVEGGLPIGLCKHLRIADLAQSGFAVSLQNAKEAGIDGRAIEFAELRTNLAERHRFRFSAPSYRQISSFDRYSELLLRQRLWNFCWLGVRRLLRFF